MNKGLSAISVRPASSNGTGAGRRWAGDGRMASSGLENAQLPDNERSRNTSGCPTGYRRRFCCFVDRHLDEDFMHSITMKGHTFTLSPLTLGDLRRLEPILLGAEQKIANGFGSMLSLVPVIHASISKLHPEIALEELEEMLDLNNFPEVLDRVLEASGLKRQSSEASRLHGSEAGSPGEPVPAAD